MKYDWLTDALQDSGTVVTASRRLARVLRDEYSAEQLQSGKNAWRSPSIFAWQDWLLTLSDGSANQDGLPTRINTHQSQLLWERCLRKEFEDSEIRNTNLVRLSRDTWQLLADWRISIRTLASSVQNTDQRLFASVAGRYLQILERENWIDDAGFAAHVRELIKAGSSLPVGRHTFAGFDRPRPIDYAIWNSLEAVGIEVINIQERQEHRNYSLFDYETDTSEFRAAGAWARRQFLEDPNARIAIIASGLSQDAERIAGLVREGTTPGWRNALPSMASGVNISYGRRLADYPAIGVALLLLRWVVQDINATEASMLLRTPLLGIANSAGRTRLELRIRRLPDRRWSPAMLGAELRGNDESADAIDWLTRVAELSKFRRDMPGQASPSAWAEIVDEVLSSFGWPGGGTLDSVDFQLVSRWRELLNEFARLALVSKSMSPGTAIARIDRMAAETVFQPESGDALVQVMGPLEASGSKFDAIWLTGMSTSNWPPAGAPSRLISRRLQEQHEMPDSSPADTLQYAQRLVSSLISSAPTVVCSFARTVEDVDQTESSLLPERGKSREVKAKDPGWFAADLINRVDVTTQSDRIPQVEAGEDISGGALTVQRQINDPASAFIHARLGASSLDPQAVGIPAPVRGSLIHEALHHLYIDRPSSSAVAGWSGAELEDRINLSVNKAFSRYEKNVDAVTQRLFSLERLRVAQVLQQFVRMDGERGNFIVSGVEGEFKFESGPVVLSLRFDRIDQFDDGTFAILDYKTGARKPLLNRSGDVQEVQLFVYACASELPVSAVALINIDSREIAFDGAGRNYSDEEEWPQLLDSVGARIEAACRDIANGDVRINMTQDAKSARVLNLLTRYTELRHDDR